MSDEIVKLPSTSNNIITTPKLSYLDTKVRVKFDGSCLKLDKITYTHETIVNIYIVYKLSPNFNDFELALENCLFGAVKLTKNADIDKYKYSGYGIGLDAREIFLHPSDGNRAQNVIIFGVYMSSFVHANNKTENILILGEGTTQELDDTA